MQLTTRQWGLAIRRRRYRIHLAPRPDKLCRRIRRCLDGTKGQWHIGWWSESLDGRRLVLVALGCETRGRATANNVRLGNLAQGRMRHLMRGHTARALDLAVPISLRVCVAMAVRALATLRCRGASVVLTRRVSRWSRRPSLGLEDDPLGRGLTQTSGSTAGAWGFFGSALTRGCSVITRWRRRVLGGSIATVLGLEVAERAGQEGAALS